MKHATSSVRATVFDIQSDHRVDTGQTLSSSFSDFVQLAVLESTLPVAALPYPVLTARTHLQKDTLQCCVSA